ncbi:MAG: futalosine hydrolase [Candidatus Eremiobacteraeota bacterium]|nr:futalosine hydrolase [Candidatus Eremiobacteraeota bacterium]MBV8498263.1 futalosine hydrolase [Candidatus Eremiobacteraeota bacterium]
MILLSCAVEAELAFWEPRDGVVTLVTGVGPVEASCALTAELCRRPYRLVVNAGLAGAFDGAAQIGDGVVIGEDVMEIALESGAPLQLPRGERTVERASSDAALVARLRDAGFPVVRGITVARVTASEQTARRLATELRVQVESMEGFAVLRAAQRLGVAAVELRGISNRCGVREDSGWNFDAGIAGLARVARALFELV